jgi:hypothetical protein
VNCHPIEFVSNSRKGTQTTESPNVCKDTPRVFFHTDPLLFSLYPALDERTWNRDEAAGQMRRSVRSQQKSRFATGSLAMHFCNTL